MKHIDPLSKVICCVLISSLLTTGCSPNLKSVQKPNELKTEYYSRSVPTLVPILDKEAYETVLETLKENYIGKPDFYNDALTFMQMDLNKNLFPTNLFSTTKTGENGYITCRILSHKTKPHAASAFCILALVCTATLSSYFMPVSIDKTMQSFEFSIYDCYDRLVKTYEIDAKVKRAYWLWTVIGYDGRAGHLNVFKRAIKEFEEQVIADTTIAARIAEAIEHRESERKEAAQAISIVNPAFESAVIIANSGNYESALTILNNVIAESPYHASSYLLRGVCHYEMGYYVEALNDYTRCAQLAPRESGINAYINKALVLIQMNKPSEAYVAAVNAVDLYPNDENSRFVLALTLDLTGRYAEAIEEYNQVLSINPNRIELHDRISSLKNVIRGNEQNKALRQQELLNRQTVAIQQISNAQTNMFNTIGNATGGASIQTQTNSPANNTNRASLEYQLNKAKKQLADMERNQKQSSSSTSQMQYNMLIVQQRQIIRDLERKLENAQ